MHTVFLVDDEPWTLQGLRQSFDWSTMGFSVIGESTDSAEALEMIDRLHPDVIFTDVRMGEISGLDLIRIARSKNNPAVFVFISGYADFIYAQEALHHGAFDYLLKPIHLDEAAKLLQRINLHLDARHAPGSPPPPSTVGDAFGELLQYVSANYCKPLHLRTLSETYYINFTYCSELFKKRTGKTFSVFMTELRMAKALELMKVSTLSINRISMEVGYNNYPHFSRTFHQFYGVSPSFFREELLAASSNAHSLSGVKNE